MPPVNPSAPFRRPSHPPLAHVPIGAVVITAVLDVISLAGGGTHPWAREIYRGGTFALMVGTAALFLAAATGLADRARATAPHGLPRRKVNRHAAVMAGTAALCVAGIVLRENHYAGAASTPPVVAALSLVTLIVTAAGGDLGGRLVYGAAIGVQVLPGSAGTRHPAPAGEERPVS